MAFRSKPGIDNFVEHPNAAVPDGFRWALIPEEPGGGDRRRGEIIKYNDPKSKNIKEFKYERLSNMKERIRLLELMAGKQETSEVECQLFEGEIKNGKVWRTKDDKEQTQVPVQYEALSWSWGSGLPEYQVLIRKGRKRQRKPASKDLVWALRYLRFQDKDRILWIDAICIDQKNVEEKNHQVQMMSQIYSYADRVCIWLGLDDKESNMAINFIKNEILQLEHFDALCTDENNSEKWQSLLLLMQRQWFFRRWVVQEIALAKDAVIYCGPDQISWKDFSVAVELFVEVETATHRLSEVMKKDPRFYHVPGWFEFVSALGASLLVEATGMIFRYYKPEKEETTNILINRDKLSAEEEEKRTANENAVTESSKPVENREAQGRNGQDADETESEDTDQSETDDTAGQETGHSERDDETDTEGDDEGEADSNGQHHSKVGKSDHSSFNSHAEKKLKSPDETTSDDPISQRRPLLSLEYLVSKLSIFEATEPRDAIYALLAIANDGYPYAEGQNDEFSQSTQEVFSDHLEQKPFPVNYGRPYADVCQSFIEFCIARSDKTRALDILCRPWAPQPKPGTSVHFNRRPQTQRIKEWLKTLENYHNIEGQPHSPDWKLITKYFPDSKSQSKDTRLPSWIPRLDGAPFAMFPHAGIHIMKMGRKNADPLVGLPQVSRNYDSAQSAHVDLEYLRFRKRRWQNAHCMFVKGFILETVERTTDSSQSGSIPDEWLKLGKWKILKEPEKDKGPPEDFWRTIVADRGKDGRNPPYYYSRACKESVYKGGLASGSVNTSDLINNERNSIVAQFCRRVQAVIWNRSLIKTDKGNLGVANKAVKKGDLVCILYGCSVPVILRRRMKSQRILKYEEEEDRLFEKVESILRRYMNTAKAIKMRKEKWRNLPDTVTEEAKEKGKWGKEDVRLWLADYRKLAEKLAQEKKNDEKPSPTVRLNAHRLPKKREDCYYQFLGECYIHGMMDGEAMRQKAKYEDNMADGWAQMKKMAERDAMSEKLDGRNQAVDPDQPPANGEQGGMVIPDEPLGSKGKVDVRKDGDALVDVSPESKGSIQSAEKEEKNQTIKYGPLTTKEQADRMQDSMAGVGDVHHKEDPVDKEQGSEGRVDDLPMIENLPQPVGKGQDDKDDSLVKKSLVVEAKEGKAGLDALAKGKGKDPIVPSDMGQAGKAQLDAPPIAEDPANEGLDEVTVDNKPGSDDAAAAEKDNQAVEQEREQRERAEEAAWDEYRGEVLRDTIFELR